MQNFNFVKEELTVLLFKKKNMRRKQMIDEEKD